MRDRRHLLKIKLKSLAAEARIIRKAEGRLQIPALKVSPEEFVGTPQESAIKRRQLKKMHRAKFRGQPWYDGNRADLAEIQDHRKKPLRRAARATHLAYGFLKGRTYQQLEGSRKLPNDSIFERAQEEQLIEDAAKMAAAYGAAGKKTEIAGHFDEWVKRKDARLAYTNDGKTIGLIVLSPSTEFGTLIS